MLQIKALEDFLRAHYILAYFILFLGSYFETIIGISFFVYGEVFFIAGAVLAGSGYLNVWIVGTICILGGLSGDSTSFWIGKKFGSKLVKIIFKKENKYLNLRLYKNGKTFLHSRGKKSIFFARFIGPLSWVTPFIAGTMKIKYKDFIKYNWPGVILGIGSFILTWYVFGISFFALEQKFQKWRPYFILLGILFAVVAVYIFHKINLAKKLNPQ